MRAQTMHVEKRDDGEWLVGALGEPNDCDERDPGHAGLVCTRHLNGEHISCGDVGDHGERRIDARWPIVAADPAPGVTMTTETTVDVRGIKSGLRDLARHMPDAPVAVHEFGTLLASYLNDEIYPEAIVLTTMLLMNDVSRGKSGYMAAEAQIPARLVGLPRIVLASLELAIPSMLRAAAGEEHRDVAEQLVAALEREPAEVTP